MNLFDPTKVGNISLLNGMPIVSIGLKLVVAALLLGYVFFALFLYLRVRILSLTLTTPNAGIIRYFSLLHFFAVLGLALFLGLLLLF